MNIADDLVRAFNDGYEKGKADAEFYLLHCGDTDEPQTNADRIRSMTDEELYDLLWGGVCNHIPKCTGDLCSECVHSWLKSPVEVDNG